jgi:hypothetical protein
MPKRNLANMEAGRAIIVRAASVRDSPVAIWDFFSKLPSR